MAASLVTLAVAKAHLNVAIDDDDGDIEIKSRQASAIVLDYLRERANVPVDIDSSAVGSPSAIITTTEDHGFTTGMTVVITDHEDSDPSIDGTYVVTVISSDTFSIPTSITTAGTGGLATGLWTSATVPSLVQAAVLLVLGHLHEHRGDDMKPAADLWAAIERLLVRSANPGLA